MHDRYFLALLPGAAARAALAGLARAGWGRPVHPDDLHLTLAFLGVLRAPTSQRLMDALAPAVRGHGPLSVVLDRLEVWPGPSTVCAAGEAPAVSALARALAPRLAGLGYAPDNRRFKPHVTLARGLPRAATEAVTPLPAPIAWESGEILLMARSGGGRVLVGLPRYAVIGRRPLD